MTKPTFAVAAIMKDEGPYLIEWIAWHRMLGIKNFVIADNGSSDGMTEILIRLDSLGIVKRVPYPATVKPGTNFQANCYSEILDSERSKFDWIFFIDADEFIFIDNIPAGIGHFLQDIPDDIGALALNWKTFGSSGKVEAQNGLTLSRFTKRARESRQASHIYKTLVRSKAAKPTIKNPHHVDIKDSFRRAAGDLSNFIPTDGKGFKTKECIWTGMHIRHYVVRSYAEYWHKKARRGVPTTNSKARDDQFFKIHDLNDIDDPIPASILNQLDQEIQVLKMKLTGIAQEIIDVDLTISEIPAPNTNSTT
ncbi:glycosyltransferase family 2 protein [Mangrovicoccus sp. HB161399]|uniref:glycosyltransferase family 2 protein n=1 Tax=Mangrovicoccus sp. HB161399 TaxID=2720392 RepID=UPI001555543C|nr:glycosyltransferase family 2 protein [Mangrovicoccus sp. HB161399]